MQFEHTKVAIVAAWMLGWSVLALSADVSSAASWILIGAAVLPPFMLMRLWQPPAQTTSESIREVLK
jgi:hypothetical protein